MGGALQLGAASQPRRGSLGPVAATALRPARREVSVHAVAALPIVDLGRTAMLDTTRAARVEASTTGALAAAVSSSIIHMEATASRFPWAASSKAERRRKAASTFPES